MNKLEAIKAKLESLSGGWFAVKRTKASPSYQFYEPHPQNRQAIDEIAPNAGNYEVIELVEATDLALCLKIIEVQGKALDVALGHLGNISRGVVVPTEYAAGAEKFVLTEIAEVAELVRC